MPAPNAYQSVPPHAGGFHVETTPIISLPPGVVTHHRGDALQPGN